HEGRGESGELRSLYDQIDDDESPRTPQGRAGLSFTAQRAVNAFLRQRMKTNGHGAPHHGKGATASSTVFSDTTTPSPRGVHTNGLAARIRNHHQASAAAAASASSSAGIEIEGSGSRTVGASASA
ncbi:unnamed protein product, partial [Amoebophrya sp. A120]